MLFAIGARLGLRTLIVSISAFVAACSAATVFQANAVTEKLGADKRASILKMRALTGQDREVSAVQVEGVERTAPSTGGPMDAHILYVHGMGWAERAGTVGDSWHLVRALEKAYGVSGSFMRMARMCAEGSQVGPVPPKGGLRLGRKGLQPFSTDDPQSPIVVGSIACMDRVVLDLGDRGRVSVYRLLWDDLLYDAVLYPHIGYDDDIFSSIETAYAASAAGEVSVPGYENLHSLRAPRMANVKDNLSSYGLSEAALYLGELGNAMRESVAAAICLVADESEGVGNAFAELAAQHRKVSSIDDAYIDIDVDQACKPSPKPRTRATFSIVTESLGSRVVFDTFAFDPEARLAQRLAQTPDAAPLEVFMLANQIPLLAPGRLQSLAGKPPGSVKARLVAISEINDVLSYELVPYFEHLYNMRCRLQQSPECPMKDSMVARMAQHRGLLLDNAARRRLSRQLGFDAIDVRAKFAPPLPFFSDAVDPEVAHGTYLDRSDLVRVVLCGVEQGRVRGAADGCLTR